MVLRKVPVSATYKRLQISHVSTVDHCAPPTENILFTLPLELREAIYAYVLPKQPVLINSDKNTKSKNAENQYSLGHIPLLYVDREMHADVMNTIFRETEFVIHHRTSVHRQSLDNLICLESRSKIRRLRITKEVLCKVFETPVSRAWLKDIRTNWTALTIMTIGVAPDRPPNFEHNPTSRQKCRYLSNRYDWSLACQAVDMLMAGTLHKLYLQYDGGIPDGYNVEDLIAVRNLRVPRYSGDDSTTWKQVMLVAMGLVLETNEKFPDLFPVFTKSPRTRQSAIACSQRPKHRFVATRVPHRPGAISHQSLVRYVLLTNPAKPYPAKKIEEINGQAGPYIQDIALSEPSAPETSLEDVWEIDRHWLFASD